MTEIPTIRMSSSCRPNALAGWIARAEWRHPFLKRFTVFNADQCEDLPADIAPPPEPLAENLILPQAEALIRTTGADLRIGGNRAFYVPSEDYI
jgi:antirestriction protein ArdC